VNTFVKGSAREEYLSAPYQRGRSWLCLPGCEITRRKRQRR